MNEPKILVKTEKYMANRDHYDEMDKMGFEVYPVDLNDAYVAVDKHAAKNLEETEENLQERFNLNKGGGS